MSAMPACLLLLGDPTEKSTPRRSAPVFPNPLIRRERHVLLLRRGRRLARAVVFVGDLELDPAVRCPTVFRIVRLDGPRETVSFALEAAALDSVLLEPRPHARGAPGRQIEVVV